MGLIDLNSLGEKNDHFKKHSTLPHLIEGYFPDWGLLEIKIETSRLFFMMKIIIKCSLVYTA